METGYTDNEQINLVVMQGEKCVTTNRGNEASKHGIDAGCSVGGDINVIANISCMRTESIKHQCVERLY